MTPRRRRWFFAAFIISPERHAADAIFRSCAAVSFAATFYAFHAAIDSFLRRVLPLPALRAR